MADRPLFPFSGAGLTQWHRTTLALLLVAALNGLCYPLIVAGQRFAPLFSFAALRAAVAGLALALLAVLLRRPAPTKVRIWAVLAIVGLASTSLGYLGMFYGAEFLSPGLATIIGASQPLIAALLGGIVLRERLGPSRGAGLLLGFAGIVLISAPQLTNDLRSSFAAGLGYITIASIGLAVGNVLMKSISGRVDPLVAMAAQLLFGAVPLGIVAVLGRQLSAIQWTSQFLISLLGLALLGTALGYWLWFSVLARVPLNRANAFNFLTPLIGVALGVAFFAERPGPIGIAGLAVTAVGVALTQRTGPTTRQPR